MRCFMKVMQIDVNYKYSSTGKIVSDLHHELIKDGHQSFVAYGRGPKVQEHNVYKFGLDFETNVHALLTRLIGLTGIFSPFSTSRLIKQIKRLKPDIVHIHELHAYFVNHAKVMTYLKKYKIPTIWTFHCEYMYTGKCGHAHDCTKFMTECHHCPQKKEYPKSLYFDFTRHMFKVKKRLFENFDNLMIVTPSTWLQSRVELSFLKSYPKEVIHNGIDTTSLFHLKDVHELHQELKINDNELVILSIAPDIMSIKKGGPLVLKLAEKLIDFPVRFILIGVNNLDISFPQNVTAYGRINDQEKIAQFYNLADVTLLFSQRENFPTTAIESLSCGTPIMAFDTGGTKETASKGYGTFLSYGDIKQAEKLIRDKIIIKKTSEVKKTCSSLYGNLYSVRTMYDSYLEVYKDYVKKTI